MNVLMLGRWLPPANQPVRATREYQFARHLARSHRLTLAFVSDTADLAGTVSALRGELGDLEFATVPRGWKSLASAVRLAAGESCTLSYFRSEALQTRLADRMRRTRYDRVLVSSSSMIQYALDVDPAIPIVVDFGSLDSEWWAQQAARGTFGAGRFFRTEAARLRMVEAAAARRACRCVVETSELASVLATMAPGAVASVIPSGVDVDESAPVLRAGKVPTVVLNLDASGDEEIVTAIEFYQAVHSAVRSLVPTVRFVITGGRALADVLAAKGHTGIEMATPGTDRRLIFHDHAVAVSPLLSGAGLRRGVLEAMVAGVPVVASSRVREQLGVEAGMDLRVSDTATEFSAEIVGLLQNGTLRREVGMRGRRFVQENLSWGRLAVRFEEVVSGVSGVREIRGGSISMGVTT